MSLQWIIFNLIKDFHCFWSQIISGESFSIFFGNCIGRHLQSCTNTIVLTYSTKCAHTQHVCEKWCFESCTCMRVYLRCKLILSEFIHRNSNPHTYTRCIRHNHPFKTPQWRHCNAEVVTLSLRVHPVRDIRLFICEVCST